MSRETPPCAVSDDGRVWAAYHDLIKRLHWDDPAYVEPAGQGGGLDYRCCLGCGSHLAIEIARRAA